MLEVEKASESVAAGLCASPALTGLSNEHIKDHEATWDSDFDDDYDDSDLELLKHVKGLDVGDGVTGTSPCFPKASGCNTKDAAEDGTSQSWSSFSEAQTLDRRLNAQLMTNELDDALESLEGGANMDSSVQAAMRSNSRRQATGNAREKDKADRATYQTVLDPRTRLVLLKMLKNDFFTELNGCVSTGKEANVYQARTADGRDLAVKIYKTSVLTFKTRDRYVRGDFRFKSYCKSNPRKMVKVWAEKEFRNLSRLKAAGVRCPAPAHLRMHVLLMEFVGANGVAAPRLKDAQATLQQLQTFYTQLVVLIRQMYQQCHLVHADLSEYNILVHDGDLWIIDVSQSVDLDHPRALQFLREDATHVNAFFRRTGVATLTVRELFDFAVDPNINDANIDQAIDALIGVASSRPVDLDPDEVIAEKVFREAYIPRRLEEVDDYENDFEKLAGGGGAEGIYYQTLAGMRPDMRGSAAAPAVMQAAAALRAELQTLPEATSHALLEGDGEEGLKHPKNTAGTQEDAWRKGSSATSSESGSDAESSGTDSVTHVQRKEQPHCDREAERAARKAHKAAVKEANREKRKQKIKKHVKKRAMTKHKHK